MVNPLQSALNAALAGVRGGTADAAAAARKTERSTLGASASGNESAAGAEESSASPELYAAVTQQLQARGRFSASLSMLKQADQMMAETIRLL